MAFAKPQPAPRRPTPEQVAILGHHSNNLLVNAFAGTGKSSTMEMVINQFDDRCLYVAFNRSVVKDMKARQTYGELSSKAKIQTLNGLGYGAWMRQVNHCTLDEDKFKNLFRVVYSEIADTDAQLAVSEAYPAIRSAVSTAKNLGYVPKVESLGISPIYRPQSLVSQEYFHAKLEETPDPLTASVIETILILSIRLALAGTIDFDDQVYMPTLFGGDFPHYPLVIVDEGQDLSPINHKMLERLSADRVIVVGDRQQSIYAFRGAVTSGLDRLKARYHMDELPLSISFRCPSEIVKGVHWHVPGFRWSREGGRRAALPSCSTEELRDSAAVICRNNAPLFALAFKLIASGRGATVMGSDIGPRILGVLRKLVAPDARQSRVLEAIDEWQTEKLATAKKPSTIIDQAECMRIFARHAETVGGAISWAEKMFQMQGPLTLLTGHKAKGLEFDTVYHIDGDDLIDMNDDQDRNLRYVIDTRAKENIFLLDSKDIIDGNAAEHSGLRRLP